MSIEKKHMTCIICPMGCQLELTVEDGQVAKVEGNTCARGPKYAVSEFTSPVRTLTTTVRLEGCGEKLLPVRTSLPIPKNRLFDAMKAAAAVTAHAPVRRGDVLVRDFLGEGADLIACRTVE